MRVLIDVPEDHLAALDALAKRNGRSRAAEVREAVSLHLGNRTGNDWIQRGFGYWQDGSDASADADEPRTPRKKALPRLAARVRPGL